MAYKENYNRGNYNRSNNNNYRKDYRNNDNYHNDSRERKQETVEMISQPLHLYYNDKAKLLLPGGVADTTSKTFGSIKSYQLRKILNQIKKCKSDIGKTEFTLIRNRLFFLLPMAAYNAGRNTIPTSLYKFLYSHINENSIKCEEDIVILDELFTSIIAYHEWNKRK